jgi:hypothetical protein
MRTKNTSPIFVGDLELCEVGKERDKNLLNSPGSSQAKELLTQYLSTDVTDTQLINASDFRKEFGITAKP